MNFEVVFLSVFAEILVQVHRQCRSCGRVRLMLMVMFGRVSHHGMRRPMKPPAGQMRLHFAGSRQESRGRVQVV